MIRGINTAASGMVSIINLNDIIAHNLANVNTPGFKQLIPTFKNVQEVEINDKNNLNQKGLTVGSLSMGSMLDTTQLDFEQGALRQTGRPLDVALNSEGFFVIEAETGENYTRNGSFFINEDGDLLTRAGGKVVGESGRAININLGDNGVRDMTITADGRIMVGADEVDRLKIVNFDDLSALKMQGNTLFKNIDNQNKPIELENYAITQGHLETSNSNIVKSMISSIAGSRTYETLSKVISNTNITLRKAVNDVGRVIR